MMLVCVCILYSCIIINITNSPWVRVGNRPAVYNIMTQFLR